MYIIYTVHTCIMYLIDKVVGHFGGGDNGPASEQPPTRAPAAVTQQLDPVPARQTRDAGPAPRPKKRAQRLPAVSS